MSGSGTAAEALPRAPLRPAVWLFFAASLLLACQPQAPVHRETLDFAQATTGADGRVTLTLRGGSFGVPPASFEVLVVTSEDEATPISGVRVSAIADAAGGLVVAKAADNSRYMEFAEFTREELGGSEERDIVLLAYASVQVGMALYDLGSDVVAVQQQTPRVLEERTHTSVVCLTSAEFRQRLEIPRSFLSLASSGLSLAGVDVPSVVQFMADTAASDVVGGFLDAQIGAHNEYVVVVANTPSIVDRFTGRAALDSLDAVVNGLDEFPFWAVVGNDCDAYIDALPRDEPAGQDDDDVADDDDDTQQEVCNGSEVFCDDFDGSAPSQAWSNPGNGTVEDGYLVDSTSLSTGGLWPVARTIGASFRSHTAGSFEIEIEAGNFRHEVGGYSAGEFALVCDGSNGFPACSWNAGTPNFDMEVVVDGSVRVFVDGQIVCEGCAATGEAVGVTSARVSHVDSADSGTRLDWFRLQE